MYQQYFLMKERDVIKYVQTKIDGFTGPLTCKEIGDGNLNYVFRVENAKGHSVIVKQAGPQARISDDFVLSTDRNRIETEVLMLQGKYTPDLVPEILLLDETMGCCVMEDLKNFEIMRKGLMQFKTFPNFAQQIATFMAENLIRTTDFMMNPVEKKKLQKQFINPELCEITEHLVYTEPYIDFKQQNIVTPGNEQFIQQHIYGDKSLHIKVAALKQHFLTSSQALLHGDLHTGSIFINENELKVIDPEFAFFGPIGYDVGCLMANLTFAWARGIAYEQQAFVTWIEDTIRQTITLFEDQIKVILQSASEQFAIYEEVREMYIRKILRDSIAVAGVELNRRIIGLAQVTDITTIEPLEARLLAERKCLWIAKACIMQEEIATIDHYLEILGKYKSEVLL